MKWHQSLQFKYAVIVLIAILFVPIIIPLYSLIAYVPANLSHEGASSLKGGSSALVKNWHHEAENLTGKSDADIRERLQKLNKKYPSSQIFWVDSKGQTRGQFSYKGTLPKQWTAAYTIQFMKENYDSDPFTVVAFIGKNSDRGFMVIKVDRNLLDPPLRQISSKYNYLYMTAILLSLLFFIFLSFIFFRAIRKRLLRLRDAMMSKQENGIPAMIAISKKDEIGQLEESFNLMISELEEGRIREQQEEKLRRELIANLSHDLRTPLTTIRAHLSGLTEEISTVKGKETLHAMDQKIDFMANLIENLLSYTLLSGGKYPYRPAEIEMNRFIRGVIAHWYPLFEQSDMAVELEAEENASYWTIDPRWMERIMDNLVQNVIRHASDGRYIKVSLAGSSLSITDRGKGFQNESTQTGAGIGLMIVDLMLKEMGLCWDIQTGENGTCITITAE